MKLASVKVGDVVLCDVKGRRFHALVAGKENRRGAPAQLRVDPIEPNITYRMVKAGQVAAHWRRSRQGWRSRQAQEE